MTTKQEIEVNVPFYSKEFIENPYPFYERIQRENPIQWVSTIREKGWFITGYHEAKLVLTNPQFQVRTPLPRHTYEYKHMKQVQKNMMLYQNEENHKRIRRLFQKPFAQQMVENLRPLISKTIDSLLEQVKDQKEFDVMQDFSYPLPSFIIAEMLGIPNDDREKIKNWTNELLSVIDLTRTKKTLYKGNERANELIHYFQQLLQERKGKPKHDLISKCAASTDLTEDEMISQLILLMVAGHETTVNLIANSILNLIKYEEERYKLMRNPELISSAIEECLRFESPTQITARYATEDMTIGEETVRRGYQVYVALGAANRDPNIFKEPHRFQIDRHPNPHLSFGSGIHFCLGSQLARLEAQMAIQRFFEFFPNPVIHESTLSWRRLIGFRALQSLRVGV
ncbi:cytochrome P450 [Bacillus sp. FJAT-47783]|uniref:cytochrome P450 n=1 Tax=Bacillus sp. FJAT-47783 TaxID=2922712 RepID=UPI001FAB6E05|nr:cytochrome P450 [Bacillus sp. FJAT-47783]